MHWTKDSIDDIYDYEENEYGEIEVRINKEKDRKRRERLIQIYLSESGLSPDIDSFTFDSYSGDDSEGNLKRLRQYSKKFFPRCGINLYLWSRIFGTQKTTIASVIGKELLVRGFSVYFILMADLTKALEREGFEDSDSSVLYRSRDADFLILDDCFDVKKMTVYKSGYQFAFLDKFIRQRFYTKKPICFTSNIPLDEIAKDFTPALQELMTRSVFPFHFKDKVNSSPFGITTFWDD